MISAEQVGVSPSNQRFLVRLSDGGAVEAVLYRGDSLCISTGVGCAVRCPFCESGSQGLARPLRFEELVAQVEEIVALCVDAKTLRRVTLSGVGEPLHCNDAPRFVDWARQQGLSVSLTTSGGPVPRFREWLVAIPHRGLTVSVHAGTETTRARMVPGAPSLQELFSTIEDCLPTMTARRRKKLALAYLMIRGENDSTEELESFARLVRPLGLRVHLYAYNEVPSSSLRGVTRAEYEGAYDLLRSLGLSVHMSSQARIEANGGCGTLVADIRRRERC